MRNLTPELAREAAAIRPVQLTDDLVAYVKALPGARIAELVEAIQMDPSARSVRLCALSLCDEAGVMMFPDLSTAETELARWPAVWVLKLADSASQANGLHIVEDADPETGPGA